VISTGREKTHLGPIGMNSEQEMSKQETKTILVSVTVCSNRRNSRWFAVDGTWEHKWFFQGHSITMRGLTNKTVTQPRYVVE